MLTFVYMVWYTDIALSISHFVKNVVTQQCIFDSLMLICHDDVGLPYIH